MARIKNDRSWSGKKRQSREVKGGTLRRTAGPKALNKKRQCHEEQEDNRKQEGKGEKWQQKDKGNKDFFNIK